MAGITVIVWAVFLIVNWLRFGWTLNPMDYVEATAVLMVATLVDYATRPRETRSLAGLSNLQTSNASHRQTLIALVFVFGTMVMLKDDSLSRSFLAIFFSCYYGWISWSNRFGCRLLVRLLYRNRQKGLLPTLLLGSPHSIGRYCENPRQPRPPGTDVLGCIPLDSEGSAALPLPVAGQFSDLRSICEEARIKALLLLGLNDRRELMPSLVEMTSELGIRMTWIDDIRERFGPASDAYQEESFSFITQLREPLEDPVNRAIKRGFDLIFSSLGILVFLPPAALLVAILHHRFSPGPLLYRQPRTGRHGETFDILKFRSMKVSEDDHFRQAEAHDDRIFRGGTSFGATASTSFPS